MSAIETKTSISDTIKAFSKGDLTQNSMKLFQTLGYNTERQLPFDEPTFAYFRDEFLPDELVFNEEKALVNDWNYIDLLFQLSVQELTNQISLFDTKQVDNKRIESYLFLTIGLSEKTYSRTQLSQITREINLHFPMPVMILFSYNGLLTLSIINRRLHKKDTGKDVLEKVTVIKDIKIDDPHRAHIEILFDLSFDELKRKYNFTNFVELHNAWQKTLDTKELNKRFYSDLFNWYLWAIKSVNFPNDVDDDKDDQVYNSESVIRLLTRLIFVWFIKEKNLIPKELFELSTLKNVLKGFSPNSMDKSVYYRAILQNLFFATLNTPMDKDVTNPDEKRRFVNVLPKYNNPDYTDQTKYRYEDSFTNPDAALRLFSNIPFLNGGLFECLDFREGDREIRYDGFSSNEKKQAFVPDKLFFAEEFLLDLNDEYGTRDKRYKAEGLINILGSYKFTITENTPLEEEIALDPELLGKVFENLLASYNPETQTTARKQTGSFYTPREIVNYMVDESLLTYLKQRLDDSEETEKKLRYLFLHSIDGHQFDEEQTDSLIGAISQAKILDPACGSGAFPMGILHRMVDLLNKLDKDNKKWFALQKQRAIDETAEVFEKGDVTEREIRLKEINKAFDLSINYPDYARKLFLIENCIYGVDIQQIAIQISKLRFFISLIVDQKVDDSKPNRNILSMPNLETRFVAANTLIGLDKPQQLTLIAGDVDRLEKELATIRHQIFFTRKYQAKKELKKREADKRKELEKALEDTGYTKNIASQMAGWNPFDPINSAPFFETEAMFGFVNGFNIVIGNPPFVQLQKEGGKLAKQLEKLKYETFIRTGDVYSIFYEKGVKLLSEKGVLCFISSNKWMRANYGASTRKFFAEKTYPLLLIDFGNIQVFDTATVDTNILLLQNRPKARIHKPKELVAVRISSDFCINAQGLHEYVVNSGYHLTSLSHNAWIIGEKDIYDIKDFIEKQGTQLRNWVEIKYGVKTGFNDAFIIPGIKKQKLLDEDPNCKSILKKVLRGKDISAWHPEYSDYWLIGTFPSLKINIDNYPSIRKFLLTIGKERLEQDGKGRKKTGNKWFETQDQISYWQDFEKPKIIYPNMTKYMPFVYDEEDHFYSNDKSFILLGENLKYLTCFFNSKLFKYCFSDNFPELQGGTRELRKVFFDKIPVKKITDSEEIPFVKMVDYLVALKKEKSVENSDQLMLIYFEQMANALVFEFYFKEEFESRNLQIAKYISEMPDLDKNKDFLPQLRKIYVLINADNHPIKQNLFSMLAIPQIELILNSVEI
ncbi:Eco57I restriction-modification methylase domain-containing protein [Maribellus mangrovi]|uniref:Eco57I restriction-modification methylase domain-containing protein n=1 Tax=Maribellus mangrovi TaxID=3133146 RepID=UPI0030EBB9C5